MNRIDNNTITISGFNMRSLNCGRLYVQELMDKSDIIGIAEHRLYNNELYKLNDINCNYDIHAKASSDLQVQDQNIRSGHCGIGLLWRKELSHCISIVETNNDRICAIELSGVLFSKSLFVICVYMPHQACKISTFENVINALGDLLARVQHQGEVVIIGDTNCHFGREIGNRGWGKTTKNAKTMIGMIEACNLILYDLDDAHCKGPTYTFNVDGVGSSYIDHCIISPMLTSSIVDCRVLEEHHLNMSDHLPIVITMNVCALEKNEVCNRDRENISWHKLSHDYITEKYTKPLSEKLEEVMNDINEKHLKIGNVAAILETACHDLVSHMHNAAVALPRTEFKSNSKPYWNEELTELAIQNKRKWREWVVGGRPRDRDPLFLEYKECKTKFRKAQKKAVLIYEQTNLDEITKSEEMNSRYFWYLVNKTKGKGSNKCPIKLSTGEVITDEGDIREVWGQYFKNLYSTSEDENFDATQREHVRNELSCMSIESYKTDENILADIKYDEIEKIVCRLADRKAPGFDGITNEHIRHGGTKLIECLTNLFEMIVRYECVPKMFKIGIIIPIPKNEKDRTIQDNYRGITLMPVMAKLLEKWMMNRIESWAKDNEIIHQLQGAAQSHCSSLHSTWLARECIADNRERGKNVYVCLLDIKKAFDSVWQEGLFYKLFNYGLCGKTWRMIRFLFHDFKCMVKYSNGNSFPFNTYQGIHQGSPLSMFLFEVYINDLLFEINYSYASAKCVGVNTGGIAFADDIALISNSMEGIQELVRIAYRYSKKWRFLFNPTKCSVVQFGKAQKDIEIKLGANKVKIVKQEKHLGVVLTDNMDCIDIAMKEKIQQCKSVGYSVHALGSHNTPVTPKTFSKVHWTVCMPKLCYGTEVLDLSEGTISSMEAYHCDMAKQAQNLPKHCSNMGSLATLGWKRVREQCNFLKMIFIWQLLSLSCKCVFKEICIKRLCLILYTDLVRIGPVCNIIGVCKEYGMCNYVKDALESGKYMSKDIWKNLVKDCMHSLESQRRLIICSLYKTMKFLSGSSLKMSTWWIHAYHDHSFSKRNRIIIRMLLNISMYAEGLCKCCTLHAVNNIPHILFICPCNNEVRQRLWNEVRMNMPGKMNDEIENMTIDNKTVFILNACKSSYVPEWKNTFDALSNFISEVFTNYKTCEANCE